MKHKFRGFLLALTMLVVARAVAVDAQATTFTQRFTVPFSLDDFNPCTGEPVILSGELRIKTHTTIDSNGDIHATFSLVPQHVIGEGASGSTYRAVGGHREHINYGTGSPLTFTLTDTFNLISQGGGDNYTAFTLSHVTVNANGVVTADTFLIRAECRG
jgi:hypothetical protein